MTKKQAKKDQKRRQRSAKLRQSRARQQHDKKLNELLARVRSADQLDRRALSAILKLPFTEMPRLLSIAIKKPRSRRMLLPLSDTPSLADIAVRSASQLPITFRDNLRLSLVLLSAHAEKLQRYVDTVSLFERDLLAGNTSSASSHLETIISENGYSLWSIEAGMLLGEIRDGVKGNREHLAFVQAGLKSPSAQYIASFISQRIETDLPVAAYRGSLNANLADVPDDPRLEPIIADMRFRLDMHGFNEFEHLSTILDFSRTHSICDLYNTCVRVLICLLRQPAHSSSQDLARSLLGHLGSMINDPAVAVLTSRCSTSDQIEHDALTHALFAVAHDYTAGSYEAVIETTRALLLNHPECLELYDFLARASAHHRVAPVSPFPDTAPGTAILHAVSDIAARHDAIQKSASLLLKCGYAFDCVRIGHRIVAYCLDEAGLPHPLGMDAFRGATATRLSPWDCARVPTIARRHLLASYSKAFPKNMAVALQVNVRELLDILPSHRALKYHGLLLERQGDHKAAIPVFARLKEESNGANHLAHVAIGGLVRCCIATGQYSHAAAELVDAYLRSPAILWGDLQQRLSSVMSPLRIAAASDQCRDFVWPLLLYVESRKGVAFHSEYDFYAAYDNELRRQCVTRPTELLSDDPSQRLIAFLRWVCLPDVMRRSYVFANPSAMESERLALLQYLLRHDPVRSDEYADEIGHLTTTAALREAVTHIEESLIYVNTEGVARGLGEEHSQKHLRFCRIAQLEDESLRRHFAVQGLDFSKVVSFNDLGFMLFRDLFFEIRDAFVLSKADGLETYLSMRIRHGTLSGKLRGQLENAHLVTRQSGGEYARNEHWDSIAPDSTVAREIDLILRDLSRDIDSLLDEINTRWIRVRSDDHPEGLFDYSFTDQELFPLYLGFKLSAAADPGTVYQPFVDRCLELLWERTARLLQHIRLCFTGIAQERLTRALGKAEARITEAWPNASQSTLGVNVANSRTLIQRDCQAVSEWFTVPTTRVMPPFDLRLLLDTVAAMVTRIHQGIEFVPAIHVSEEKQLGGKWFAHFVDMCFIVLDNTVRHGHPASHRPTIRASADRGSLVIVTSNTLAPDVNPAELAPVVARINSLQETRSEELRVQSEGQSGLEKLHNIIRNDLHVTDYEVTASFDERDKFTLSVRIDAGCLFHEEST